MKAADARKLCPELSLVQVPTRHGKADISLYRCACAQRSPWLLSYLLLEEAVWWWVDDVVVGDSCWGFRRSTGAPHLDHPGRHAESDRTPRNQPQQTLHNLTTGWPRFFRFPIAPPPRLLAPPVPPSLITRHAGEKVVTVLETAGGPTTAVEKASIDEVYVDVTRAAQALLSSLKDGDGAPQKRAMQQRRQQHEGTAREKGEDEEREGGADEEGSTALTAPPGEERKRGPRRWEDIGEGGWAAVVLEAASTHVSGWCFVFACLSPLETSLLIRFRVLLLKSR